MIKESNKNGVKYFFCVLYMPTICHTIIKKVNPKCAFIKKKDAENHVALLAIYKLRKRGFINDYLFPYNLLPQKEVT